VPSEDALDLAEPAIPVCKSVVRTPAGARLVAFESPADRRSGAQVESSGDISLSSVSGARVGRW